MPDYLKLLGVFVMSAVYHSYSHLAVPPRQRPWGELAGTLLTPKNKLPGIARHENPSGWHRCHCKVMCPPGVLRGLIHQDLRGEKGNG